MTRCSPTATSWSLQVRGGWTGMSAAIRDLRARRMALRAARCLSYWPTEMDTRDISQDWKVVNG